MQLVHVIPLTKAGGKEELTYFSAQEIPAGSIVTVPIRTRMVPALVSHADNLEDARIAVKRSGFATRKLPRQKPRELLSPSFVAAAKRVAEGRATNLGAVLSALLPKALLESSLTTLDHKTAVPLETKSAKLAFQAPRDERLAVYRSLIRESFARGHSLFILVPTIAEGEWLSDELSRGIESYCLLLHASLPKKELTARLARAADLSHPMLLIATGGFLAIPRADINTIIIEREGSSAYRQIARPFLDLRLLAEALAEQIGARTIFADFPLSIETLWRFRQGELDELAPLKLRVPFEAPPKIIDQRTLVEAPRPPRGFEIIGAEVRTLIEEVASRGGRAFLFCARRGLAPITVCQDCQMAVACGNCGAPVVLQKMGGENMFFCRRCKASRSAKERCLRCRSWKLASLGIGIERVAEELKRFCPSLPVLKLDRDSVKSHKEAKAVAAKFYAEDGVVLLGTELAMHYLTKPFPASAVISLDSLLSIPEWRIAEKIFSLLVDLELLSKRVTLIQTRKPNDYILRAATQGSITDFYAEELKLRELFHYPPASVLIKISSPLPRARALTDFATLKTLIAPHELEIFELAHAPKERGRVRGLIRVPQQEWPSSKLLETLSSLPPSLAVSINPENIFQ